MAWLDPKKWQPQTRATTLHEPLSKADWALQRTKQRARPPSRHMVRSSTDEPSSLESVRDRSLSPTLNLAWSRSINFSMLRLFLEHAGHSTPARGDGTPSSLGPLLGRQISDGGRQAVPKLAPGLVRMATAFKSPRSDGCSRTKGPSLPLSGIRCHARGRACLMAGQAHGFVRD